MNCTKMYLKMCITYEHMPKNVEILNFEQLLKHIFRVAISKFGGGGFNSVGLDHSGSQTFILNTWDFIILYTDFSSVRSNSPNSDLTYNY